MEFAVHLTATPYRAFPADAVKESLNTMRPIMVEMGLDPELFYFVSLPRLHLYVATVTDAGLTEYKKLCTIVRNIICDDPSFLMDEKEIMYDRKTFRLSNAWQSTIVQTARFIEMVLGGTVKYDLDIVWVYGEIFGDSIDLNLDIWVDKLEKPKWIYRFLPSYRRHIEHVKQLELARAKKKDEWNLLWELAHD